MDTIKLKAYAKINLGLDVIRKREDGYHDVRMIMQTIGLYDQIQVHTANKSGITIKTNLHYLPTNENNLVYRAAKLLIDECGIKKGLIIELNKHIPVSAGMAGGSTDAAAILFGLNKMFKLGLSLEELMKMGLTLGADIPFCLLRGTALSEGIGEILTPLNPMPKCFVLIAKPTVNVSTKYVYENLKIDKTTYKPDIDGIIKSLNDGDLHSISEKLSNVLESVTIKEYPIIEEIKDFMKKEGALNALMSGSGPTVFGLFDNYELAGNAYFKIKTTNLAKQVFLTDIYNNKGDRSHGR